MKRVELIYDRDCPNVPKARAALGAAFAYADLHESWIEWDRQSPDCPVYAQSYGSPTILVDGVDVGGAGPMEGTGACRVYSDTDGGLSGVPSVRTIVAALQDEAHRE